MEARSPISSTTITYAAIKCWTTNRRSNVWSSRFDGPAEYNLPNGFQVLRCANTISMLEKKSIRGYWWVDENPDRKVAGSLEYDPDEGIDLKLLSPLDQDLETLEADTLVDYDRIYGITEEGNEMTLMDCKRGSTQINLGGSGIQTSEYMVPAYIDGYAFVDGEDIEFSRVSVEYPLLDQWANQSGASIEFNMGEESNNALVTASEGDTIDITYEFQDSMQANVEDYTISLTLSTNTDMNRVGGVSIDETTKFEIEKQDGSISLEEMYDVNSKLQDFITLAVRKPTFPSSLEAKIPTDGPINDTANIVFNQLSNLNPPEQLHSRKTNFLLPNIEDRFEETLSIWFELYTEIKPTYDLFFGTKYNDTMFERNRFLGFTQALETYHRRSDYTGTYLEEDEFNDYKEELIGTIHKEHDQSFQDHMVDGVFEHANEYSLRKRLNGLVDAHETVLSELPWDVSSEINPIVNTRNYLTHYDDDSGAEMDRLREHNLILEALLEACLLTDLEIPEDHIRQRLESRYHELTRDIRL